MERQILKCYLVLLCCLASSMSILVGCVDKEVKVSKAKFTPKLTRALKDSLLDEKEWMGIVDAYAVENSVITELKNKTEQEFYNYVKGENPFMKEESFPCRKYEKIAVKDFILYLENSASMKGYFPKGGNVKFTETIIPLFNLLPGCKTFTFFIGEEVEVVDSDKFQSQLANGEIANGKSSPLDEIFNTIIENTRPDQVSALLSDAIISGTNSEISSNREFNYVNKPVLQQRIRKVFEKAKEKRLAILIHRFCVPFQGTYYNYRNNPVQLHSSGRPFFVFLIGTPEVLVDIHARIEELRGYKPDQTMQIGIFNSIVTRYELDRKKAMGKEYKISGNKIRFDSMPLEEAVITVKIDLSDLPEYARSESYLKKNLSLFQGKNDLSETAKLEGIEVDEARITFTLDRKTLARIPFDVSLRVANRPDSWYEEYASDKDETMAEGDLSTFALKSLINGVLDGIGKNEATDFVCLDIGIERK